MRRYKFGSWWRGDRHRWDSEPDPTEWNTEVWCDHEPEGDAVAIDERDVLALREQVVYALSLADPEEAADIVDAAFAPLTSDPNDPSPNGGGGEGELANEERSDVKAVSSPPSKLREALELTAKSLEHEAAEYEQSQSPIDQEAAAVTRDAVTRIRAALATEEER